MWHLTWDSGAEKEYQVKTKKIHIQCELQLIIRYRDFPGSPEAKALSFHSRGHGFIPWSGNYDPACRSTWPKKKKKKHNKVQYWFIACKKCTHTNIIKKLGAELCVCIYIYIYIHIYIHTHAHSHIVLSLKLFINLKLF